MFGKSLILKTEIKTSKKEGKKEKNKRKGESLPGAEENWN